MRGLAAGLVLLTLAACKPELPRVLGGHPDPVPLGEVVRDPISGMTCPRGPTTEVAVYQERNFYFCAPENRRTFHAAPERYAFVKGIN